MSIPAAAESSRGERGPLPLPVSKFAGRRGVAAAQRTEPRFVRFPKNKHNNNKQHWREKRSPRSKKKGREWDPLPPAGSAATNQTVGSKGRTKEERSAFLGAKDCRHMVVTRQYTSQYRCDLCGKHPAPTPGCQMGQGFLYCCVEDRVAPGKEHAAALSGKEHIAEPPGKEQVALLPLPSAAGQQSGGCDKGKGVEADCVDNEVGDVDLKADTKIMEFTSAGKSLAPVNVERCQFRVCHNCQPRRGQLCFQSIDGVINGDYSRATAAEDAYPRNPLLSRPDGNLAGEWAGPVADADVVKNLGLRAVPERHQTLTASCTTSSVASPSSPSDSSSSQSATGLQGSHGTSSRLHDQSPVFGFPPSVSHAAYATSSTSGGALPLSPRQFLLQPPAPRATNCEGSQRDDGRSDMNLDGSSNDSGGMATACVPYYQLKALPPPPPRSTVFQPPSLLRNETPLQLHNMVLSADAPKTEAYRVMLRVPQDAQVREIIILPSHIRNKLRLANRGCPAIPETISDVDE